MKTLVCFCFLAVIFTFTIMNDSILAQDEGGCPPSCCGGGSFDWASVTLIGMEPRDPIGGWINLYIEQFSTFEDGCDAPIEFAIKRGCWVEIAGLLHGSGKSGACMVICGAPALCPEEIGCFGCPGLYSHSCGFFNVRHPLWGKGEFLVFYKGSLIFRQAFDYSDGSEPAEMKFTDIFFLNKDFTEIHNNDIFDGMESVALLVYAEFSGDQPEQGVGVVLGSDLSPDTIIISLPLAETNGNIAVYDGILHEGTFIPILGDRNLPPYVEGEITARPVVHQCDEEPDPNVPEDRIRVANFVLWVEEISFESDYQLCKDGPASQPGTIEPIEDPVWIKDTKNEPVAYRRNSRPDMSVVVKCNKLPYHDFQYWIKAGATEGQRNYSTDIYQGSFNSSMLDTVFSVTFSEGNFPDSVGIIESLEYWWYANKAINFDPMYYIFLNRSTQKIFLTYEEPRFSPVNILGLDKICRYAESLNEPGKSAEAGVSGVYGQMWNYDPGHTIFVDPLDVIRNTTGQCADYANLLTYLYRSIGLPANSVTIYNGATFGGLDYLLYWEYSVYGIDVVLLSKMLRACNGTAMEWYFNYHATCYSAGLLCDPVFGITAKRAQYDEWWRYYLYPRVQVPPPPYSHIEPPNIEPTHHDWPVYVPDNPLPSPIYRFNAPNFSHP